MRKFKYRPLYPAPYWLVILCFLLSGCLIQHGRIATDKEIVEHPQSVAARDTRIEMWKKAEEGRHKYFNSYKIIYGWWDKL